MKSQDVLVLLKLVSLEHLEEREQSYIGLGIDIPNDWRGWAARHPSPSEEMLLEPSGDDRYSVRALEHATGISKSEISAALRRCERVGLVRADRKTDRPRVNTKALYEFISYGLKYVFPATLGTMVKGIPTAAFAPVLNGQLFSGSEISLVWEDPEGSAFGQRVSPIHKSVPHAVRSDPLLYALLALVDSIRLGHERETSLSRKLLEKYLGRAI